MKTYAIRLKDAGIRANFQATNTGLDPSSSRLKKLIRPSPDLSLVSITDLAVHDSFGSINSAIDFQMNDGSSYDSEPWSYLITFEDDICERIASKVKIVSTPNSHPCHYSLVPINFDENLFNSGSVFTSMHFNLNALTQTYEAILKYGTLHANIY